MTKIIQKKNFVIAIIILILIVLASVCLHFQKYNTVEWLKHFDCLEGLNKISYFSFWWYLCVYDLLGGFIYIFPILLIALSCYSFSNIYHTGFIQNIILRVGYKKTMLFEILKSWIYALILPIVSLITFIISRFCYSNSTILNYVETDGYPFQLVSDFMSKDNPYLFMIIYFVILFLFGIIIINFGLICTRYLKRFSLISISSFLLFIFIENINNLLIAPLIADLSGIEEMMNGLSIYNLYYLNSIPSLIWEVTFAITFVIITTLFVFLSYRSEEKVVLEYD